MYRRGIVTRTDPKTCRVRVRFPDRDDVESWWLEVAQDKTLRDKAYWMPDVGEAVACIMDEHGEAGVVVGALYSKADPPPTASQDKDHVTYDDGAVVEYDRAAHRLLIDLTGSGGTVHIKSGSSEIILTPTNLFLRADRIDWNDDR